MEYWVVIKQIGKDSTIYAILVEEEAASILCAQIPNLSYHKLPKDVEIRFVG